MRKMNLKFEIPVSFLKEKDKYIAYSPVLDLSTSADSYDKAKERFKGIVNIFFEEIIQK